MTATLGNWQLAEGKRVTAIHVRRYADLEALYTFDKPHPEGDAQEWTEDMAKTYANATASKVGAAGSLVVVRSGCDVWNFPVEWNDPA